MRVDIHSYQAGAVGGYPDVSASVACHAKHASVHVVARHAELVANGGVPCVVVLVIHHQCAVAIQPDVVYLVGECLQRCRVSEALFGDVLVYPQCLLLVGDVAAGYRAVVIHYQCSLPTFAYRHHIAFGDSLGVGCVAEFIHQLLLGVVCKYTTFGDIHPHVLSLVDIHYLRCLGQAHLRIHLPHVALKALGLGVIYAHPRGCLHPQVAVECLLYSRYVAVGKRRTVLRVALEVLECIAVVSVQSGWGAKPYKSS